MQIGERKSWLKGAVGQSFDFIDGKKWCTAESGHELEELEGDEQGAACRFCDRMEFSIPEIEPQEDGDKQATLSEVGVHD